MNKFKTQLIFLTSILLAFFSVFSFSFASCSPETPEECDQEGLVGIIRSILSQSTAYETGDSYYSGDDSSYSSENSYGLPAGFQFSVNLALGSRGEEVRYLQQFLNSDPDTQVASYGYGSPGMETSVFSYKTKNAVIRFQQKYAYDILFSAGYYRATGFWGVQSRNKANELIGNSYDGQVDQNDTNYYQSANAQCGSSNGQSFEYVPTNNLCSAGNASSVTGYGPWYWTCSSSNGEYSSCSANKGQNYYYTSGVLSINLSSDNPTGTTLVAGQGIADLAHYTFVNNSSYEARITNFQLKRIGVSSDSTLKNVYLFDGNNRLTDSASVSSGRITFNNSNGVFVIPANSTKIISIKADIDTNTTGQTTGVSLEYVGGNVQISGQFPLNGNTFSIANGNLATVNISNIQPSSSITTDPTSGTRVWEATFNVNNKNVRFTRLALKQINSIETSNITNFRLLIDGSEVSQAYQLNSNGYIVFTFDRTLNTGTRNIKVLADILGGSSRTVQMSLRSSADIDMKDSDYNVSIVPTGLPATAGAISVNVGQMIIYPDNSYLPSSIAKNGNNILIGKFKFRAGGEDIRVDNLKFGFNSSNALVNSLRNGRVMINGSQAGSTSTLLKVGTIYYINYTFQAGIDTSIEVYADTTEDTSAVGGDTTDNLSSNDTLAVKMITQIGNGTRKTSYNVINVPSSDQTNATITISQGNVTVSKKSNYGDQTTVLPQTAYKIGSWNVYAGGAESININNLNFAISPVTGTSFSHSNLANLYVNYSINNGQTGTTSIKNTVNASNDFSVSFSIGTNSTMSIDLYADLIGTVTAGDSMRTSLIISGNGSQSGVSVNTPVSSGQIIINNNPSLLITRDASTPISAIVDDSGNIKTVSYKFESQNDTYTINQLTFNIADPSVVTSVILKDGNTILQERPGASTVVFSGFSSTSIPANSYRILDIELVMSAVGAGAGTSGADVTTGISMAGCLVRASNGSLIVPNGVPLAGNKIYVYKAYPTLSVISQNSGSNEDRLTAGDNALLKFNIASNGGVIAWKKMKVNVTKTASTVIADSIRLVDSSSGQTIYTLAAGDSNCEDNTLTSCDIIIELPTEEQISGSKNYELRGTISGGLSLNNYISSQVSSSFLAYSTPSLYTTVSGTASNFIWSDFSAQGHSSTTADWNNDNLVRTLPMSWTRTVK